MPAAAVAPPESLPPLPRTWRLIALSLALATASPSPAHAEPSPRALAEAALSADRLGFQGGSATLSLELRDKQGRIVSRKLEARGTIGDGSRKMRLTFLEPIDQRGVELLLLERRGEAPTHYLWLPKNGELRKVSSEDREARAFGADFALAELAPEDLAAATITRLPDETLGGEPCYVLAIDLAPSPTAAVRAHSRVLVWLLKSPESKHLPVRFDFARAPEGPVERRLEVRRVARVGPERRLTPSRLVATNLVESTQATLDITNQDPAARFPDAIFAPEALGR